tara:strand:- start:229 stop:429 length:201 start_codon:yes stop_codon:yes gene_type:complete
MFKFSYKNINDILSKNRDDKIKLIKIGMGFILFGLVLYILKEILIGFISLIFIFVGISFFYKALKI